MRWRMSRLPSLEKSKYELRSLRMGTSDPSAAFSSRKNSTSGPTRYSKPRRSASSTARRSTPRGSPWYGSPSGVVAQQIRRAVGSSPQGSSWNVDASGTRYMSDSAVRAKESTDEPSNQVPWAIASESWDAGIVTVFTPPITSVNWRSIWRTCASSTRARRSGGASLWVGGGNGWPPTGPTGRSAQAQGAQRILSHPADFSDAQNCVRSSCAAHRQRHRRPQAS